MAKKLNHACIVAINAGTSSIKFALKQVGEAMGHRGSRPKGIRHCEARREVNH
jgi:hypothetical protein